VTVFTEYAAAKGSYILLRLSTPLRHHRAIGSFAKDYLGNLFSECTKVNYPSAGLASSKEQFGHKRTEGGDDCCCKCLIGLVEPRGIEPLTS
jgi:hypothetical protein